MPKCPHGELDRMAAVLLACEPHLTLEEIARKFDCSVGTLRNRRKYPKLAAAWEMARGGRFAGVRAADRRRNGRPMPGAAGDDA